MFYCITYTMLRYAYFVSYLIRHVFVCYSEIVTCGGIESLITLLSHSKDAVISNTCVILTNMSTEEEVRSEVQRAGVITALMSPLQSKHCNVQVSLSIVTYR